MPFKLPLVPLELLIPMGGEKVYHQQILGLKTENYHFFKKKLLLKCQIEAEMSFKETKFKIR